MAGAAPPSPEAASPAPAPLGPPVAFLLVRLGTYCAAAFAEALAPLGLEPRQFGVLNRIAEHEGTSQQALGELLGLHPTRMVFLVDELEERGLVERRRNPSDRRTNALHVTPAGRRLLTRARSVAAKHGERIGAALPATERRELGRLLQQLADAHGLPPEGLPIAPRDAGTAASAASRRPARRAGAATT